MLAGLNPTGGLRTAQLDRQGNLLVAHSALSMGADAAGRTRGSTLTTLFDGKSLNGYLSADVAGVPDEVVLAYVPATNTQTVIGTLWLKEH